MWGWAGRRYATTATTDTLLMLVRLTATTDLIGLPAECLSAPVRGMAGDAVGAGVVGVAAGTDAVAMAMVARAGATDAVAMATDGAATATDAAATVVASPGDAVRLAASTVEAEASMVAVAGSTEEAEASMAVAAVGSTVEAVVMAAEDTVNRDSPGPLVRIAS